MKAKSHQKKPKSHKWFNNWKILAGIIVVLSALVLLTGHNEKQSQSGYQQFVEPEFVAMGDCAANQVCPTNEPSQVPYENPTGEDTPADGASPSVTEIPNGTSVQPTGGSKTRDTLTNELISLIRQLIALLGGGQRGCPTSADDVQSSSYYDDVDNGLAGEISAFSKGKKKWGNRGRGHRHWKKWHRKHHKGLWKRWKCGKKSGTNKSGGQTPSLSPVPSGVDIQTSVTPEPSGTTEPAAGGQASCGQPGDQGNSQGVGKYCTKGGGECQGGQAPYCALDFKEGVPGVCSKPCATNADCGENARCSGEGLEKGCEPTACGSN